MHSETTRHSRISELLEFPGDRLLKCQVPYLHPRCRPCNTILHLVSGHREYPR